MRHPVPVGKRYLSHTLFPPGFVVNRSLRFFSLEHIFELLLVHHFQTVLRDVEQC